MALTDPRTDESDDDMCIKCLSKKAVCIAVGWAQVVLWAIGTIIIIYNPSSTNWINPEMDTLPHVLSVLLGLACFGFCLLFVYGLHNDRKLPVNIYILYVAVNVMYNLISFIVNLSMRPKFIDFKYFFNFVFDVAFHTLCFFIARGYYEITYCNYNQETAKNNQISV